MNVKDEYLTCLYHYFTPKLTLNPARGDFKRNDQAFGARNLNI